MRPALLCQTVTGRSMAELVAARDAATAADLVELRLDGVADLDVGRALAGRTKRVILTCRAAWEGGSFDGSEDERKAFLTQALQQGADYVDIEWRAGFDDLVREFAPRVVLSSHDFNGVPADLPGQARAMRQHKAGLIKIAVMPERLVDTLPLKQIARDGDAIVVGMGDTGMPSRILASHFGSRWTYAGNAVAPGQLPPAQMVNEFRFPDITQDTTIYGVVGNNVAHSLSPVMHNAAFRAAGLDAVYVPFRPKNFKDFFVFASMLGVRGASVTIPYKVDALTWPSMTADAATLRIGAANTLRRCNEGWEATNTDDDGFLDPLERVGFGTRTRTAVLGAGGAARAVVSGLASRGAAVTVYARRLEQAQELADAFTVDSAPWPPPAGSWDMLVNCTPLGGASAREDSPLPDGPFDGRLVYDLTYGPGESRLLRDARAAGCQTLDGLPMLIAQAERQFQWWTGQPPQAGVMEQALRTKLGRP